MRAELKSWDMGSADYDVESYRPENPDNFEAGITASIGPVAGRGADLFQFRVVTPRFLEHAVSSGRPVWGRHTLIVKSYDPGAIRRALETYLSTCEGSDWHEVGLKVSRIGHWEFEDYRP